MGSLWCLRSKYCSTTRIAISPCGAIRPISARWPRKALSAAVRWPASNSLLKALRGHLAEIGVVAPQGAQHAYDLKRLAVGGFDENGEVLLPGCVRVALRPLIGQIDALDEAIGALDKEIAASVKADETAKRLMTVPGIGLVTASAIVAVGGIPRMPSLAGPR